MEKELKLKIFLSKSKLRQAVWNSLNKEKTATDISKELGKHRSSINRVLLDMKKQGFVQCLNPEDSNFKFYVKNRKIYNLQ